MSDQAVGSSDAEGGNTRKILLFAILGLLVLALAYDYRVARPSVETAYNKIVDRNTEVNRKSTEVFTNLDVRQLIGKEPSRTFEDANGDLVEVYSWRSGLPIRSHELFTVFKPNNGKFLFYRHAKFKYETSGEVSNFSVPIVIEQPGDDPSLEEMPAEANQGSGGGGGPGGGQGRPRMDPAARFAENDADGDGFLRDDEIPVNQREAMSEIDTDGDGAISKDEMMARAEAMRARFGGGPGQQESDRVRVRSRPEAEEPDSVEKTDE